MMTCIVVALGYGYNCTSFTITNLKLLGLLDFGRRLYWLKNRGLLSRLRFNMLNRVHAVSTDNGTGILVHGKFRALRDNNARSLLNRRCSLNIGNILYIAHVYSLVALGCIASNPVVWIRELLTGSTTGLHQVLLIARNTICSGNKFFGSFWLCFRKGAIPRVTLVLYCITIATSKARLTFNFL